MWRNFDYIIITVIQLVLVEFTGWNIHVSAVWWWWVHFKRCVASSALFWQLYTSVREILFLIQLSMIVIAKYLHTSTGRNIAALPSHGPPFPHTVLISQNFAVLPMHTVYFPRLKTISTCCSAWSPGPCPPVHIAHLRRTVPSGSGPGDKTHHKTFPFSIPASKTAHTKSQGFAAR